MQAVQTKGRGTYLRLLSVSKRYWVAFLIGIVATVLLSLSDASFAWLIQPIVNKGFIDRDGAFIRLLPVAIIILFLLRSVASFCSTYFVARVARNVVMDFRRQLFRHLMRLPAQFYDKHSSGKLLSTILYNVEQVAQASSDILITVLREASLAVGLVIVMFAVNWRLSLIFLLITPLIAWGIKVCSKRLRKLSSRVQRTVGEVSHVANEGIEAYQVVRLFGGQKYEEQKFDRATKENRQQELKMQVTNGIGTAIVQMLISIPLAFVLYLATSPSFGVTAGSFAAIVSSMIMIVRPMRRITSLNNFIQKGIAGAESIFALLDEEAEQDIGTVAVDKVKGDIEFNQVYFSYQSANQPSLQNISLNVNSFETVALVGRSGAGKSTLVNLLPRFYEVESGEIKIDGVNINDYRLKDLRNQFALVSQNTVLFNDTVANNIAYASPGEVDSARVIEAAKMAYADEFIQKLPGGYDAVVGEDGLLLSGGQRQRLAIARALYKRSPILILDEATSALDSESERQIQAALSNLMRQCTTLVIAHRLSTIESADKIVVVDEGKIIEMGSHQDLLASEGVYAELYRVQFKEAEKTVSTV